MKSLSGEKRPRFPRLCTKCYFALGPRRNLRSPLGLDALRTPNEGMVEDLDSSAERVIARKERKRALRGIVREGGIAAAAKFFLSGSPPPPPSDECEDCLALRVA